MGINHIFLKLSNILGKICDQTHGKTSPELHSKITCQEYLEICDWTLA